MKRLLLLLPGLLWHQPAHARCRVVSPSAYLEEVQVKVPGHEPFELTLDKVPVEIRLTSARTAALQVREPLRFLVPSYPTSKIRFLVDRRTELYGGRLTLAAGLAPTLVAVKRAAVRVKLPLTGLTLRGGLADVPCGALTSASGRAVHGPPAIQDPPSGAPRFGSNRELPLYRRPREVDPLWVKLDAPLALLERRKGWVRLQLRWTDGSSLQGWVPEGRLDPNAPLQRLGLLGTGGVGTGSCGRSHPPHLVPFTIRRGAQIAAGPGGPVWARAATRLAVTAFPIDRQDGWVQIAKLTGLPPRPCSEHQHLWVHVREIVWQKSR